MKNKHIHAVIFLAGLMALGTIDKQWNLSGRQAQRTATAQTTSTDIK